MLKFVNALMIKNKNQFALYICYVKSLFSIFLALLVLVSTAGVGVTTHFCGNRVASVSFLGDAGCTCNAMEDADGCCSTERAFFQVDDDFSVTPVHGLSLSATSILSVFVYHLSFDFVAGDKQRGYLIYKPPLPEKDFPVLHQSFLI